MEIRQIPLSMAFDVAAERSTAEALFDVPKEAVYGVDLTFLYDAVEHNPSDRDRVWHLVGGSEKNQITGQWEESGAPLILEIALQRRDADKEIPILQAQVTQPHLSSWGKETLTTELTAARLPPGIYHLVVRNLRSAPILHDVRSRVDVVRAYRGK